jgi:capsular exopolysaccharide synthesis family protein
LKALARMLLDTPQMREAYVALLGSLRQHTLNSASTRSILVTSAHPNEGKTTVATYLAITASLVGQRALLIDGDFRRPFLARAAGIADGVGLGEILDGRVEAAEAVHRVDLFDDFQDSTPLSIICSGGISPDFLPAIDWPKARTIFQAMSQDFGIVLLDSPPILTVNDALLLASIVDGILLVVGAGSADREEVRIAKEQLETIGTPVIGAVLNQFDPKVHGKSKRPYGSYNYSTR